ncbi:MAG: penicillin-binding protein 2 [Rhodobacteraceae bacterium]|nr:MAG: penicillin-binding protein 2 [Paracoccaceae bacterium]
MKRPGKTRQTREAPPRAAVSRRAVVLFGVQALAMGGLAWRMRRLQIDEGELFRTLAEENRISVRLIPPARGEIFDIQGRPLAVNRQNYRVVMVREQAGDVERVLDRLGLVIPISDAERERALRDLAQRSPFVPVTVAEHLDWQAFALVNANAPALPGVAPDVGLTRLYPDAEAFSHVIGHVGPVNQADLDAENRNPLLLQPGFLIGKNGVERLMETELRGRAGARRVEVSAGGRIMREIGRDEPTAGADVRLTIDRDLQRFAMERMAGQSAATVVMDCETGDLRCLASAPGFDPNKFVTGVSHTVWNALLEDEYRPLANKTVSGQYPPGSTFKMVVALAALERGLLRHNETVFCNGGTNLGSHRFHCWKRGGHGHMNLRSGIQESCDVYFYEVARRVGVDAISDMARRLGLGVRHDLPLTAIRDGLMPTRDWKRARHGEGWQMGDTFNVGIGQGYTLATPLQLAVMTARLATGRAVAPRLIAEIGGAPAPIEDAPPLGLRAADIAAVQDAMDAAVNERGGTALRSRIHDDANRMAGKTGTSQVRRITMAERARGVLRNDQLPWNRRNHALFVAYAPAHAPRYALATIVEHGGGGSSAAAPVARDIMMAALYGPEPPLAAFPPAERETIRQQREAAPAAQDRPSGGRDRA